MVDFDIYASNLLPEGQHLQLEAFEYGKEGYFARLSDWLAKNLDEFGFYFPYKTYNGGVAAEPWHISYEPLAKEYLQALSPELLHDTLHRSNIAGKEDILAMLPELFQRFVLNVESAIS